jgi:putative ABC transport system ATP-binding protein
VLTYDIDSETQPQLDSAFVSARAVTKVFPQGADRLNAVADVSFELEAGSFTAVTGPSGSGKSTLLHLLGGIEQLTSGEIWIGGLGLHALGDAALARYRLRQVGFIFQAFHLIPNLTIFNNVALPGLLAGASGPELNGRVHELLARVGIEGKGDRLPHELSGGQQQRAAIARALINDPALILADEPTGNLDSASGEAVLELLGELHDRGKSLIMVTHDAGIASSAQKQLRLRDGRLLPMVQQGER